LNKQGEFLKEDYDNLKVAKEEMYNTLEGMEKKNIDMSILKQELVKKTADNADNAAAAALGATAKELVKAKEQFWQETVQQLYDQTGDYPNINVEELWKLQPDSNKQYYLNMVKSNIVDDKTVDNILQRIKEKNVEYYDKELAKKDKSGSINIQAIKFPSGTTEQVKAAVWAKLLQDKNNQTTENLGWWSKIKKWWN